ncbi:bifunctional ADP-dependent NAD(P)H-hydrate dehydratase/NAD(P)H-hydrate epimerase [Hippea alviniae]|uniref:bifunctional ADP-dependent NAD(P)H-hydrate dehydratase/NAD(P)H-hydrate epimerase n=1 Tax=Hippea alviniae TaxID=1279027 RepID=UPI0003B641F7|nr:bifunctional ADP-dependent NAD(P)H-hydrate dehydratase/NAD(P)H-hydrate epimerase [Hippea alviniae]
MKLSVAEQMRQMDRKAIETGIPDIVLMENASIKSFYKILEYYGEVNGALAVAFVGAGNNGGDALAISRHLYNNGASVFVYMLVEEDKLNPSPKTNFEIIKNMGIEYKLVENEDDFNEELVREADIIIDGIFGTGLSREVGGKFKKAIELINSSPAFVVAVDIPSGIRADTGEIMGVAVEADLTPTFALAKPGHFLYPGREYAGNVEVVDISTPRYVVDDFEPDFIAIDEQEIILTYRDATAHKGNFGHLAIVGGSKGKSGAVIMASKAALKMGVGLASAVIPESINTAFESSILEAMSYPIKDVDGFFSDEYIDKVLEFVADKTAICFGMGLGITESTKALTRAILQINKPLIIDADGLNCLSFFVDELKNRKAPTVLTPHPKEFSRLTGKPTKDVLADRLNIVKDFAKEYGVILVLKMADTLIATPDGKIYINTTGNQGLATGGSGDVLSGMIGAFLAEGYDTLQAAINGVYLHGLAADLAVEAGITYESLTPTDIIGFINEAINFLRS